MHIRNQNIIKIFTVFLLTGMVLAINSLQSRGIKANQTVLSTIKAQEEHNLPQTSVVFESSTLPKLRDDHNSLPQNISAKSYLIYDIASERFLVSHNQEEKLPIASLTKLATALTVAKHLSPQQVITVAPESIEGAMGPKLDLVAGEKITVYDLTEAMLVSSANDAAQVLAHALQNKTGKQAEQLMNQIVAEIGAQNTNFVNTTGFDDPHNYSNAHDVLVMLQEIYRNPWLLQVLSRKQGVVYSVDKSVSHTFTTTNQLLYTYSSIVIGGKTGFTDEALGNLALFVKNPYKSDMIFILIGSQQREQEMSYLIDWSYEAYRW